MMVGGFLQNPATIVVNHHQSFSSSFLLLSRWRSVHPGIGQDNHDNFPILVYICCNILGRMTLPKEGLIPLPHPMKNICNSTHEFWQRKTWIQQKDHDVSSMCIKAGIESEGSNSELHYFRCIASGKGATVTVKTHFGRSTMFFFLFWKKKKVSWSTQVFHLVAQAQIRLCTHVRAHQDLCL